MLEVAVIGIKFHSEVAELIRHNCENIRTFEYNLNLCQYPEKSHDLYIITDRMCDGKIEPDIYINAVEFLKNIIESDDIIIFNADDENLLRHLEGLKGNFLAYGYNTRASVTLSGIDEDISTGYINYVCSLQHSFSTMDNKVIEPCEVKVTLQNSGFDPHSIMAFISFLIAINIIN